MSNAQRIVLDVLGKLHAHGHGHGLFGYCRRCDRHFDVPLPALIAVRGADRPVVRMRPLRCAGCGGRQTETRITAPAKCGRSVLDWPAPMRGEEVEPGAFLAMLERLWSRSGLLLWALGTAFIVAFVALAVGAHFDPSAFAATAQSATAWLLPIGAALLVLAGFRTYHENMNSPLRIVPLEPQFFRHDDSGHSRTIRGLQCFPISRSS